MGAVLQIRKVPEADRRVLEARAAERGQSLNTYLLELISREVARPTVAEVLDRARRRAERGVGSSVEDIREGRREREGHLGRARS